MILGLKIEEGNGLNIRNCKNLPENKLKLSESLKVMWKNKSDEELKLFCETMKRVNNDIDKKERNSKTAKCSGKMRNLEIE